MGYEIHLVRKDESDITLDEWCAAIASTEGVRLSQQPPVARHPKTRERVYVPLAPGDAEVYFPEFESWIPCLWYSSFSGRISYKPDSSFQDPDSPYRRALIALAETLNAQLIGDGGEVFS